MQLTTVRRAARVSEQHLWEYDDDAGDRDEVRHKESVSSLILRAVAAVQL